MLRIIIFDLYPIKVFPITSILRTNREAFRKTITVTLLNPSDRLEEFKHLKGEYSF